MPTCGSLFSGIGLLDIGLHLAGFQHAWLCESDEWRRSVLAKRFPDAVVYDDVRTLRGEAAADAQRDGVRQQPVAVIGSGGAAEPPESHSRAAHVDLVAGGFPCKGASTAGKRQGFGHAETVLWHEMRRIIGELRPRYVLIENVANILGMAAAPGQPPGSLWGTVLGDLAALGFDVVWDCVPAAAVGAPHLRDRVFAIATHASQFSAPCERSDNRGGVDAGRVAPIGGRQAAADTARNGKGGSGSPSWPDGERARPRADNAVGVEWGDYQPAITRWEAIHGAAPQPLVRRLDDGDAKLRRMRARVDRSRLSALGDGVHVYVGWLAGRYLMERMR